jgi:subtilisin family serine protease
VIEKISDFSGRGGTRDGRNKPELTAPGDSIFSSNAGAGEKENGAVRPARAKMRGTSMSAPHVTGVVARLLSRQRYLTAQEIRDILVDSATKPEGVTGWDHKWGYGVVNAEKAMEILNKKLGS